MCNCAECVCFGIVCFLVIIVIIVVPFVFIVFVMEPAVHPPTPSPDFTLLGVKLYAFNFSTTTSTLTSTFQIDITFRNCISDYAFHFRQLDVSASYRKQQITLPTTIPPSYLGNPGFTTWSPYLNGTDVPLSPDVAKFLAQDKTEGTVLITVEVTGRTKLKSNLRTFRNRLNVNCPRYITLGNNSDVVVGSAVNTPSVDGCPVEVS